MKTCPRCGFQRFGNRLSSEREAARIRAWAEESRVQFVQGNLLRPDDVASYTGRTMRSIRRWIDTELESVSIRGRRFVAVDSLAQFIVEHSDR